MRIILTRFFHIFMLKDQFEIMCARRQYLLNFRLRRSSKSIITKMYSAGADKTVSFNIVHKS